MIIRVLIYICIGVGCFFALAGTVGLIRMPDTFCRMQSATNIATFGVLGVIAGGLLYSIFIEANATMAVKIFLIGVFVTLTNPVASHMLARAAYRSGVRPKKSMLVDDYGRDKPYE